VNPLARTQRQMSIGAILRSPKARRRRAKLPRQLFPREIEREYARAVVRIVELTRNALTPLLDQLPGLLESAAKDRSRQDNDQRYDAGEGRRIQELIEQAQKRLAESVKPVEIERLAKEFAEKTQTWQRIQLRRQTHAAFGIDIVNADPRLGAIINGFVMENVALIKDVPRKIVNDVEGVVNRSITSGKLHGDIAKDLNKQFGFGEVRAKRIARDQVGKLYGQVNASRQKALGVTQFWWRTSNDERVRDEHVDLGNGGPYSYENPPSEGLPGEPINCRCYAEPVLSDLLG